MTALYHAGAAPLYHRRGCFNAAGPGSSTTPFTMCCGAIIWDLSTLWGPDVSMTRFAAVLSVAVIAAIAVLQPGILGTLGLLVAAGVLFLTGIILTLYKAGKDAETSHQMTRQRER